MSLVNRVRMLWIMVVVFFLVNFGPALAQDASGDATGMPSGMALALLIGGILLGVGISVLTAIAPRTKNTYDDAALTFLVSAKPTIEKWLDPKDSSVPPHPDNPTGKA